ncbi:glutaredoxin family protein [Tundrisphaera sp. TA3]|uniref:glutaredoxin family protein n=1 Tax=Tundrisphaera sp. TA3 TaxID=3435775 RepID=UPI003EB8B1F0
MSLLARPVAVAPSTKAVVATVYTSDGCDCCRKALAVLADAQERHPALVVETIDIASDPDLARNFEGLTPVVVIDDKVRFRGLINPVLLDRLLAASAI